MSPERLCGSLGETRNIRIEQQLHWIIAAKPAEKTLLKLMRCWLRMAVVCCFLSLLVFALYAWAAGASSPLAFVDVAGESGIRAQMRCGGPEKKWIPEANGSGAAWVDFDRDGLMDLFIVNGSSMEDLRQIVAGRVPEVKAGSLYLYRNLGHGRFEDVTERSGLRNPYWGTGAAVADVDGDGYPDLLVTNIGVDLLFRNNHDGTFTEIGQQAGLSRQVAWHTGAAFGDYDSDGRLDLYVAGYVDLRGLHLDGEAPVCEYRGVQGFCGPIGLKGAADILYHREAGGTFVDVTAKAGVRDTGLRHGFTVVFDDFNQDGKLDLFVANDSDPNYLYVNQGDGTFREVGLTSGVAFGGDGRTQSNMGAAVGDYNNDGLPDILTTTFSEDYSPLFKQQPHFIFDEVAAEAGLATVTMPWVGWGAGFVDFDNDGQRDLWMANGHVYPKADRLNGSSYFQPISVLTNRDGKLSVAGEFYGAGGKNSFRGGCAGDFNNDGKMDLLALPVAGAPVLLENRSSLTTHWLGLQLRGRGGNTDAIGAQVRVTSCGRTQFEAVRNGGSFLSVDDPRLHFGLGACSKVERVQIQWPSGRVQVTENPAIDSYLKIDEPAVQ